MLQRLVLWLYSLSIYRRHGVVIIGGKSVTVRPLTLGPLLDLLLLLGPYLILVDSYLPTVQMGLRKNDQEMLFQVFKTLSVRMAEFPSDMSNILGIMLGMDADQIARQATPAEIVAALPVLDRVHNFRDTLALASELGAGYLQTVEAE